MVLPLQGFVDKLPPAVSAAWLNIIDTLRNKVWQDAATQPAYRANITSDLPFEIANGGTSARTPATARVSLTTDLPFEIANGGTSSRTGVSQVMQGGADTGVVNAYIVTATPAIPAILTAGALVRFTPANTNTGSATLNVGGSGAIAVIRANGSVLSGGELSSLGPALLQYTGSQWQILSTAGAQPGFERTPAETAAGIIPSNYGFLPGWLPRFGTNTVPGTTDMTTPLANALAASQQVYIPASMGRVFIQGIGVNPRANQTIYGDGMGASVIHGRTPGGPSGAMNILNIQASNVTVRDLTLEIETNGNLWCAGVQLSGTVDNCTFNRVSMLGGAAVTGITQAASAVVTTASVGGAYTPISGITQAASAVVTVNSATSTNPFATGQNVSFTGVVGMTQINGLTGNITAIGGANPNWTITVNINSTAFTPYTSGGNVLSNPYVVGQRVAFYNVVGMTQINGKSTTVSAIGGLPNAWTITVPINSSGYSPYVSGGFVTLRLNNWGIWNSQCTLTGLHITGCRFEGLDLPLFKGNLDTQVTSGTNISDCYLVNCTDGFEINSPAIGSNWTDITISNCTFTGMHQFAVGAAAANRLSVISCHFTDSDAEACHIETNCTNVKIISCDFSNVCQQGTNVGAINIIGGGALSLGANDVIVADNTLDLSQNIQPGGNGTNGVPLGITIQAGGVGNPYACILKANTFKTKQVPPWQSTVTYVAGNIVLQGGTVYYCVLGNLNQVPPNTTYWTVSNAPWAILALVVSDINISDNLFLNVPIAITGITQAASAVITLYAPGAVNPFQLGHTISITGVVGMTQINNLTGTVTAIGGSNPNWTATVNINSSAFTPYSSGGNAVAKLAHFIDISDSLVNGAGNTFLHPAAIIHLDDNSFGTLTDSRFDGDLNGWTFLAGNTNTTTSVCFDGISVKRAFTSLAAATPNPLFPVAANSIFDGTAALKFVQNGTTAAFITTVKLDWTGAALTVGTPKSQSSVNTPAPTAGQWTVASGALNAASTGGATFAGQCLLNFKGPYYP